MRGKRELAARVSARSGFTRLLEAMPAKPVLLVLNYHRIGRGEEDTPYDPGTFSCTAEELDWQIGYLKRQHRMTTLEEAVGMAAGEAQIREPAVLITFDDGYIDNYRAAFPVLRKHGTQGVFFLPTSFTGTGRLPWWDTIAYIVRRSPKTRLELRYPAPAVFDIAAEGMARSLQEVLRLYKRPEMTDHDRFVEELERACESSRPGTHGERCFLNWNEAREMQAGGMAFGSHTHTHEILSKLTPERQLEELRQSREILEGELGGKVDTLAYPVGMPHTFSASTVEALEKAGYRAAFSFYHGLNRPGAMQPFNIQRCGVDGQSRERLRLQTAVATLTGSRWV